MRIGIIARTGLSCGVAVVTWAMLAPGMFDSTPYTPMGALAVLLAGPTLALALAWWIGDGRFDRSRCPRCRDPLAEPLPATCRCGQTVRRARTLHRPDRVFPVVPLVALLLIGGALWPLVGRVALDPFFMVPALVIASAVLLVVLWWMGDGHVGGRRCPRCRYDLEGVPGDQCPECGNTPKNTKAFYGRIRSKGVRWTAIAMLLAIWPSFWIKLAFEEGWQAIVPTPVLVLAYPVLPDSLVLDYDAPSLVSRDLAVAWYADVLRWHGERHLRSATDSKTAKRHVWVLREAGVTPSLHALDTVIAVAATDLLSSDPSRASDAARVVELLQPWRYDCVECAAVLEPKIEALRSFLVYPPEAHAGAWTPIVSAVAWLLLLDSSQTPGLLGEFIEMLKQPDRHAYCARAVSVIAKHDQAGLVDLPVEQLREVSDLLLESASYDAALALQTIANSRADASPLFVQRLDDPDRMIRLHAAQALYASRFGLAQSDIDHLFERARQDPYLGIRRLLLVYLFDRANQSGAIMDRVALLPAASQVHLLDELVTCDPRIAIAHQASIESTLNATDPALLAGMLRVLGRLLEWPGAALNPAAIQRVEELTSSSDEAVRQAALELLERVGR